MIASLQLEPGYFHSGKYHAFYNLVGKFSTFAGPALIGLLTYYSASPRIGILALLLLFGAGGMLFSSAPSNAKTSPDSVL